MNTSNLWVNRQGESRDDEKCSVWVQNKTLGRSRPPEFDRNNEKCRKPSKHIKHEQTQLIKLNKNFPHRWGCGSFTKLLLNKTNNPKHG